MAQLFPMPQLGSTMEEGTILKWLKSEGEHIRKGDTLLEIETDKATMEVESPVDGVVLKLLHLQDSVVPVQKPIAILGAIGDAIEHLLGGETKASSSGSKTAQLQNSQSNASLPPTATDLNEAASTVFISPRARRAAEERRVPVEMLAGRGTGPGGRVVERDVIAYSASLETAATPGKGVRTTPLAARVAELLGVDLNELTFGLPGSRVRRDDILRHVDSAPLTSTPESVPADYDLAQEYESRPFAGMRRRIADNVSKSRSAAPHVTLTLEVDMTACADLRTRLIPEIEKAYGTRLSYTDILVKAVARALAEHPIMNAALIGDELRIYSKQNIGVAVALAEGLIVPVLRDAGSKSLGEISSEIKPLIDRARSGKFTPDDLAGGTFTITNLGAYGIDQFDPIIVPPQAGILGVCRITDKAVVINKEVAVRLMMNLCLSFDHRIVDGAPAAKFLQRIQELLENPVSVLI